MSTPGFRPPLASSQPSFLRKDLATEESVVTESLLCGAMSSWKGRGRGRWEKATSQVVTGNSSAAARRGSGGGGLGTALPGLDLRTRTRSLLSSGGRLHSGPVLTIGSCS